VSFGRARVRRPGLLVVLGLSAAATGALLAPPAGAAGSGTPPYVAPAPLPPQVAVYAADKDGNGTYGIYRRAAPNGGVLGAEVALAADSAPVNGVTVDRGQPDVSADGSRVVWVENTLTTTGALLSRRLVVHDLGSPASTSTTPTVGATEVGLPALSPDGRTVAWTEAWSGGTRLARATVGSPAVVVESTSGLVEPLFLDATTLLARRPGTGLVTLALAGGTPAPVSGAPAAAADVRVSPDGTRVLWSADGPGGAGSNDVWLATFSRTAGETAVSGGKALTSGPADDTSPSWSLDGTRVLFSRWVPGGPSDLWTVDTRTDDPATRLLRTDTADEDAVAVAALETNAPGASTSRGPATLNGTTATVPFTVPADADVAGVWVTRSVGTTAQSRVFVPAPATSLADSGLVVGTTYGYTFSAVDRAGNVGPASPVLRLTALAGPVPSAATATSATTTQAPFPVTLVAAGNPSTTRYDVDWHVVGGPWTRWVTAGTGTVRTFGSPASAGATATTSTPGSDYSFRSRATDLYGNATAWRGLDDVVVPYDQTKAVFSGRTTTSSSSTRWLGGVRVLSARGSRAVVTVTGDRLQVIGERCRGCGSFTVYVGATKVATVSSYSSTTRVRQVLWTSPTSWRSGTRTVVLTAVGTAGHPAVILDGFAVRR
jgi:WD40-like Beta Propeller Repeat